MEGKYKGIHLFATFVLGVIITSGVFLVQAQTGQGFSKNISPVGTPGEPTSTINSGPTTEIVNGELTKLPGGAVITYEIITENGGQVELTDEFQSRLEEFFKTDYSPKSLTKSKPVEPNSGRVGPLGHTINYTIEENGEARTPTAEFQSKLQSFFDDNFSEKSLLDGGKPFDPGTTSRADEAEMLSISLGLNSEDDVTFSYQLTTENGGKVELTDEARAAIACYFSGDCDDRK